VSSGAVAIRDTRRALVTDELRDEIAGYELDWFDVEASSRRPPHATVCVRTPDGEETVGSFTGDGPVDAIFRALSNALGRQRVQADRGVEPGLIP
jgi:2-isopropylmalate synthase